MKEFNWLGYCTSCNIDCCHNTDKTIPENECIRPEIRKVKKITDTNTNYDKRPLECRLFPFDIKEIDEKIVWVKWNGCHATPKLDYEKFMGFFERSFSRTVSLKEIQQYVAQNKIINPEKRSKNNYVVIREINWPSEQQYKK